MIGSPVIVLSAVNAQNAQNVLIAATGLNVLSVLSGRNATTDMPNRVRTLLNQCHRTRRELILLTSVQSRPSCRVPRSGLMLLSR
jgi:predicted TIM-barrel enzyme